MEQSWAEKIKKPKSDEEIRKSIEEKKKKGENLTMEERVFLHDEQVDRENEENQEDTKNLYVQAPRKVRTAGPRKKIN